MRRRRSFTFNGFFFCLLLSDQLDSKRVFSIEVDIALRKSNIDSSIAEQSIDTMSQIAGNAPDIEAVVYFNPVVDAKQQRIGGKIFEQDYRLGVLEN